MALVSRVSLQVGQTVKVERCELAASITEISWADPISLDYTAAMTDEEHLLSILRRQLRSAVDEQRFGAEPLKRCVYVVRIKGPVVIAYPRESLPCFTSDGGNAPTRLAAHLGKWLHTAHKFGSGVGVELRLCVPRRRARADFFKNVEADLILWFQEKYGAIPFFNSRRELKWEKQVTYPPSSHADLSRALGVGSGNRPQWAIRPLPSNGAYNVFHKGFDWAAFE